MKLQGAKQVHYDSGPNMTPLVDVVMVILIFLMLAGSFEQGGWFLQSSIPIKEGSGNVEPPEPGKIPDIALDLRVDRNRNNEGFTVTGGDINIPNASRESLFAALSRKKSSLTTAGSPPEKVQVTLLPGRSVQYEQLILVYEAASRAGFTKVGFATSH